MNHNIVNEKINEQFKIINMISQFCKTSFMKTVSFQVKCTVKTKYMPLKKHQKMLWWCFLTHQKEKYPNVAMLLEILLVFLGSFSVAERGFSTVRRVVHKNCPSMKNEWQNQSLLVCCNMPVLTYWKLWSNKYYQSSWCLYDQKEMALGK